MILKNQSRKRLYERNMKCLILLFSVDSKDIIWGELKIMLFEDFGTHTPISTIFYVDFQMIKFLLKG